MDANIRNEEFMYGIRPVAEAVAAGRIIDKVFIRKENRGEGFRELFDLLRRHHIPFQYVPEEKLNRYTRKNHQGVVALISLVEYQLLDTVIETVFRAGKDPFILLLDHVTDIRNFGAIARTAECAGIDAIVIPEKGGARINAEAIKTSAGALLKVPVCRTPNIFRSAVSLMEMGLTLVSVTEKGKELYYQAPLTGPLCLVMGSEETGIAAPLLKMSHHQVRIPQYGGIGSLNVSVAAGIILFEAARQRNPLTAGK